MTTGPLEYLVVRFEGNHFTGEILPELRSLRDKGVVRIVDLLFVQKDKAGTVTVREISDLSGDEATPYGPIAGDLHDFLSVQDVETVAGKLPNDSAAAIALLEHIWALRLQETIRRAHGEVLDDGLVPAEDVEELGAELAEVAVELQG